MNVVGGQENSINEDLFVDPDKARPTLMDFDDLKSKLYGTDLLRILEKSGIKKAKWNALDKKNRATVLNLSAKMFHDHLKNGDSLISNVDGLEEKMLDKNHRERIYAIVNGNLLGVLRKFPEQYRSVSGSLHKFFDDWVAVSQQNSFKSRNNAGNIQFTFATNPASGSLADIDLDDHTGIANTNPYDLHQILVYFQGSIRVIGCCEKCFVGTVRERGGHGGPPYNEIKTPESEFLMPSIKLTDHLGFVVASPS